MKKLLILFLAVGLLTACNNKKGKEGDKTDKDTTTVTKDTKDTKDGKEPEGDKTTDNTDNTVTGWPQKDKDDFLTSCITEAVKASDNRPLSETYCECMLGKLESEYPDVNRAAKLTDTEIQEVMMKYRDGCLGGH